MASFWHDRRVLVGGGCGFLGSYIVPELLVRGALVRVVDDLSNGTTEYLDLQESRLEFIEADLADSAIARDVTKGQDVLFNLAAKAFGMEYSRSHNADMLVSNLLCTLVPLEAAVANQVERAVIMSSSCVYPDDAPVPTPELDVFTGAPESVNEGYGWAKRMQELAGTYYAQEYGTKVSIVRPFNPYGGNYRWGSEDKAHVIPALVKRILDGEDPVVVWGTGDQERNFLHGRDAARLVLAIVEKDTNAVPVNIGYEETTTIKELVQIICEESGLSPQIIFDDSKPMGRFRKSADASKLRDVTGDYEPEVSLREGITEMISWYRRSFTA